MHATLSYPIYSLEVYFSLIEKNSLLSEKKLEGELELSLRVFPAFGIGKEDFINKQTKLLISIGNNYSLENMGEYINLIVDKNKVNQDIWDSKYQRYSHGGIYFNLLT